MSVIMGLDQSFTSTGVCINSENGFDFRVIPTVPDKEDPLEKFKRAMFISDAICDMIKEQNVDKVNIEGLALGRAIGNSNRDLAILQGVIVCDILKKFSGLNINIVVPTTLKKFATGKGNAPKDMLFECLPDDIKENLSKIPKSKGRLDLCDAYWLSVYDI